MKLIFRIKELLPLLIILYTACASEEFCAEPTESQAIIKFYTRVGLILNDTSVTNFSARGMIDYDSLLYDSANVSSISLPFSSSSNSSSFILAFSIPDTLFVSDSGSIDTIPFAYYEYDTISFHYSNNLIFISQACGFTYHFHVDSFKSTRNIIDTILTSSGTVTTEEYENFKVLL